MQSGDQDDLVGTLLGELIVWLSPFVTWLSRTAVRAFYAAEIAGADVPSEGPLLLVANHPNSLLDPAAVITGAGRPVRFLAKAPLFASPLVGWLVRGSGAIPVYRRQDDPALVGRNIDTFRAAWTALADGDAVGIFPEGRSHGEPSLGELRTGAARIALGSAPAAAGGFPILPVGLTFRRKDVFRSRALLVAGSPIEWRDLARRGADDKEAVRELTRRIDDALRTVTINVESWDDRPLVELAEAVHAVERSDEAVDPARRVARLRHASELLAELRENDAARAETVTTELRRFGQALEALHADPASLDALPSTSDVVRWSGRQLSWLVVGLPLAVAGTVVFAVPRRATALVTAAFRVPRDARSTWKVLLGGLFHVAWVVLAAGLATRVAGVATGAAVAAALLVLAPAAQAVRDRYADAVHAARRHLALTRRRDVRDGLREERRRLADTLETIRRDLRAEERPPPGGDSA